MCSAPFDPPGDAPDDYQAGNSSFSVPIRLCVEYADGEDSVVTCPPGVRDGITCTDGCVLPASFGSDAPDRMPPVVNVNRSQHPTLRGRAPDSERDDPFCGCRTSRE